MGSEVTSDPEGGAQNLGALSPLDRAMRAVEKIAELAAGGLLLVSGLLISISVICRTFFGFAVPDDVTLVGLFMVGIVVLPMAAVQATRGHIAVTVVTDLLPPAATTACRLFGNVLALAFFPLLGWLVATQVPEAFALGYYYDGTLQIPVWPAKAVYAVALLLFGLRIALSVVADARTLFGFGRG